MSNAAINKAVFSIVAASQGYRSKEMLVVSSNFTISTAISLSVLKQWQIPNIYL